MTPISNGTSTERYMSKTSGRTNGTGKRLLCIVGLDGCLHTSIKPNRTQLQQCLSFSQSDDNLTYLQKIDKLQTNIRTFIYCTNVCVLSCVILGFQENVSKNQLNVLQIALDFSEPSQHCSIFRNIIFG